MSCDKSSLVLIFNLCAKGPTTPPLNLTIYNHTAVSVWLSWEPALEPNGVVTHYGFKIQELITQTVTHEVLLISHPKRYPKITTLTLIYTSVS